VIWKKCGVAQWTSYLPEEHKTRVRIPPEYEVFKEKHGNAVVCNRLNMNSLCVYLRNIGIGHENILKINELINT
jgi:hypothetical protein